jgi:hypothetical protein
LFSGPFLIEVDGGEDTMNHLMFLIKIAYKP